MSEGPNDRIDELESQMEAAGSLIASLEEEVTALRRDLEQASVALRMAQQEVAARETVLEERDLARSQAEQEAEALRDAISELRIQNSDEQLKLRNQHIAEIARIQDRLGSQRVTDMERAFSGDSTEALKEEYRRELQETKQRHGEEIEALENSYEEWKDGLRKRESELEAQHEAEVRNLRREAEDQRKELQRSLREEYDQHLKDDRQSAHTRHEEEVQALREGFAEREQELRRENASLRSEAEQGSREAEERRRNELRKLKALAENRERELRRGQSGRIQEANEDAERRIRSLQAQRKADHEALKTRYEQELSRLRQEHEERLAAEVERRRQEVLSLEERFESVKQERTLEARAYIDRLKEIETARTGRRNGHVDAEAGTEDGSQEASRLRGHVAELEEALASCQAAAVQYAMELERLKARPEDEEVSEPETPVENGSAELENRTERPETPASGTAGDEDRVRELEIRLREAQEERRHYADELGKALDNLRRLSDPEHRLRAGISAFNESHHAHHVASISRALGLPRVHAGMEGDPPGKPTFTFVWDSISWRRYVSEPIEGLVEPRVYLVASGDDPEEAPPPEQEANARIDARGRLMLGIQAR